MALDAKPAARVKPRSVPGLRKTGRERTGDVFDSAAVLRNPQFQQLVRERTSFGWTLSAVMVVIYLGFIGGVAFAHDAMAAKVAGTEISVGIVAGLAVIVTAFVLTGVYVARANSRFDQLTRDLTGRP